MAPFSLASSGRAQAVLARVLQFPGSSLSRRSLTVWAMASQSRAPGLSKRIAATDDPIVVQVSFCFAGDFDTWQGRYNVESLLSDAGNYISQQRCNVPRTGSTRHVTSVTIGHAAISLSGVLSEATCRELCTGFHRIKYYKPRKTLSSIPSAVAMAPMMVCWSCARL